MPRLGTISPATMAPSFQAMPEQANGRLLISVSTMRFAIAYVPDASAFEPPKPAEENERKLTVYATVPPHCTAVLTPGSRYHSRLPVSSILAIFSSYSSHIDTD